MVSDGRWLAEEYGIEIFSLNLKNESRLGFFLEPNRDHKKE